MDAMQPKPQRTLMTWVDRSDKGAVMFLASRRCFHSGMRTNTFLSMSSARVQSSALVDCTLARMSVAPDLEGWILPLCLRPYRLEMSPPPLISVSTSKQ